MKSRHVAIAALALVPAGAAWSQGATVHAPNSAVLRAPITVQQPAARPAPIPPVVTPQMAPRAVTPQVAPRAAAAYALEPQTGQVRFGDGAQGARLPAGGRVESGYRYGSGVGNTPLDPGPARQVRQADSDRGQQLQYQLQDATSERQRAEQQAASVAKKQSDSSSSIIDNLR